MLGTQNDKSAFGQLTRHLESEILYGSRIYVHRNNLGDNLHAVHFFGGFDETAFQLSHTFAHSGFHLLLKVGVLFDGTPYGSRNVFGIVEESAHA